MSSQTYGATLQTCIDRVTFQRMLWQRMERNRVPSLTLPKIAPFSSWINGNVLISGMLACGMKHLETL
eukprot:scaffold92866_cov49-Attheya_sp.AAC.1